jgi:hypothetical protein
MERGGTSGVTFAAGGITLGLKCQVTRAHRSAQILMNVFRGWSLPPVDWVASSRRHPHVVHVMSVAHRAACSCHNAGCIMSATSYNNNTARHRYMPNHAIL